MLNTLIEIEKILPQMLRDGLEWNSLYVDYHKPFVERLWRQVGDARICLHRIYACERHEALFHPHPWPSAMKIIEGQYEMGCGSGDPHGDEPAITSTFILPTGSYYDMISDSDWHYVRPLTPVSYSIMLMGAPFPVKAETEKKKHPLMPLDNKVADEILEHFRRFY